MQSETLSKFLAIGMPLAEVLRAATAAPAAFLKNPAIGTLAPGSVADVSILYLDEGVFEYADVECSVRRGRQRFRLRDSFIGGRGLVAEPAA